MQIVIPMSGFGERFRRAGYAVPKPLIEVEGKPIIAHVIDLFPGEAEFIFICNEDHLKHPDYRMAETLQALCPTGKIVSIPSHKLGPVHAVRQVAHLIDPNRPVVVNYCDFTCYWDWADFKAFVTEAKCDGAIPAYKGFHPHTLGTTNYAYMKESGGWVEDIQEKQPYTDNRMQEFASSGTYYFASGQIMLEAFQTIMEEGIHVGGEFYVSLAYKPLLRQGRPVAVYPLQHFMQWGTPDDVAEYNKWSDAFKRLGTSVPVSTAPIGTVVLPMAGMGKRFADEGYTQTKPLIPVSGKPMVLQAINDLPPALQYSFVLRKDMPGQAKIAAQLTESYPNSVIHVVEQVTAGQACTGLIGLDALAATEHPVIEPITLAACDNGALYDAARLNALMRDPAVDVIVWAVRGHPNAIRRPHMFGWVDADGDQVKRISVKQPLSAPATDPIVLGTFTFAKASAFREAVARLIARDGRVNGEFYIDSCINDAIDMGLNCRIFEVDSFLCWGTPDELKTFEYWQSCFHKWPSHPYCLEHDRRVPADQIEGLSSQYAAQRPPRLLPRT